MIVLNMTQGSPEWLAARREYDTASEASIMMACSKNVTRNELLHMKTTGTDREFSEWFQRNILDKGHEVEALGRPFAEEIIGEELYPITATDDEGWLLASFDGITMLEDVCWECKQWNEEKAADVREGRVPECDKWQVVQQLRVSGAEKCLYMVTDGTKERTVYVWVTLTEEDSRLLAAGWKQFDDDRQNYEHVEYAPKPEGKTPDALPALHIELTGKVSASNLSEFRDVALTAINNVSTELKTDEDFASAEKGVKWCKDVESRLAAAKDHALSQTQTIDELFKTIDSISAEARQKRLDLEKLVKSRKEAIRSEILHKAKAALADHVTKVQGQLESLTGGQFRVSVADPGADFVGQMKGKRTIATLQSSCDDELARCKIQINESADLVRGNILQLKENAADYLFLFNDFVQICQKPADDFAAIVKSRIADHKEAEQKRMDAEREKIRQEEEAKAKQEQAKPESAPVTIRASGQGRENQQECEVPRTVDELMQTTDGDKVTLSRKEYEQLIHNSKMYLALAAAGVDKWEGYGLAMEIMQEEAA